MYGTARLVPSDLPYSLFGFFYAQRDHLTGVSKFANMVTLQYTIEYFHSRVKNDIEAWPDGIPIMRDWWNSWWSSARICGCRTRAPWAMVYSSYGSAGGKASDAHYIVLSLVNAL